MATLINYPIPLTICTTFNLIYNETIAKRRFGLWLRSQTIDQYSNIQLY